MVTPDPHTPPFNPYAAPAAPIEAPLAPRVDDPEAAALRRPNLSLEAVVRLLGIIGYGLAIGMLATGLGTLVLAIDFVRLHRFEMPRSLIIIELGKIVAIISLFYLTLAWMAATFLGRDMRRFRLRALVAWSALSFFVAIWFVVSAAGAGREGRSLVAVGFLLTATTPTAIFTTLLSPPTTRLFRPDYREAVSLTPSLRPRLSPRAWFFIILLPALNIAGFALLSVGLSRS